MAMREEGKRGHTAALEEIFQAWEGLAECRLCVHDHSRRLNVHPGRSQYEPNRGSHRKTFPAVCGQCERELCQEYCMHRLNRRVERRRERVFVKRCHAGVLEVVAPIYWNGAHVGTLFAGLWRPRHSHVEVAQPPVEPERVRRLLRVLPVLADGLAARFWGRRELLTAAASRVAAIEDYIAAHCRSGITLSSMAGHLGVSASRASHLIRELTGQTFSDLVQAKRLELAEFYLVSSDYRMKEVAQLCGFSGQEHFGRIFRRRCGRTPAVFRKQEQQRHF